MKFDRQKLLSAVEKVLAQYRERHAAQVAKQEEEYADAVKLWNTRHGEKWAAAARVIARKVRKGQPITEEDLAKERDGYSRLALFTRSEVRDTEHQPPQEIVKIRTILNAIADDVVSSATLLEFGANKEAMRIIASRLEPGSVWR